MGQMSDPKAQLTDEVNKTLNYHPLPFSWTHFILYFILLFSKKPS
jgi:hypothetical protein